MLQDGLQARAVAARDGHAAVLAELDQGDGAALLTHAHEACAPERSPGRSGRAGAMRARASLGALRGV